MGIDEISTLECPGWKLFIDGQKSAAVYARQFRFTIIRQVSLQ